MDMSRTLYFVRHGQTSWNAQKRLLGHKDIQLDDTGRTEATDAGICLRWLNEHFAGLDFIAGPLGRTRETMEIMRETVGLEPGSYQLDEGFKEVDYGRWEGLTWSQVRERDPAGFHSKDADPWRYTMPDGESYEAAAERVRAALTRITHNSVIVSHGGICRTILVLVGGVDSRLAPTLAIPQNKILVLRDSGFAWLQATTDLVVW